MDLNKILNKERYFETRAVNISHKRGAVWVSMLELDGLVDFPALARDYFGQSPEWIAGKLDGCTYEREAEAFTPEEYVKFAEAYRDIARKLMQFADEIDAAPNV